MRQLDKPDDGIVKKVTIISTLPFILTERKPGQIPGYYEIESAPTRDTLGITHVGDAWFPELIPFADTKAPARRVFISAESVAEGICQDYIGASLGVQYDPLEDGSIRKPGLFWVNGVYNGSEVLSYERDKVNQARKNTAVWFEALVKVADDVWQKYHQHIFISDLQRKAATYLGFKDREWNVNVVEQLAQSTTCPSCMSTVNKGAIMCLNCKWILDKVRYEANKTNYANVG